MCPADHCPITDSATCDRESATNRPISCALLASFAVNPSPEISFAWARWDEMQILTAKVAKSAKKKKERKSDQDIHFGYSLRPGTTERQPQKPSKSPALEAAMPGSLSVH
jgi:hypothetical protein